MRFSLVMALAGLLCALALDYYFFRRFRQYPGGLAHKTKCATLGITFIEYICLLVGIVIPLGVDSDNVFLVKIWLLFIFFSIFASKLLLFICDVVARLYRKVRHLSGHKVPVAALVVSALFFIIMWWGALINRNRISIVECRLTFPDLPAQFDGYRIVHISDFHIGSWGNDTAFVSRVVDKVNSLEPDLILFTGDIVSRKSTELVPMIPPLQRLRAKDGLYAVLGNHDYGDYAKLSDDSALIAERQNLKRLYAFTPFRLLNNTSDFIYSNGDSIAIIGVENIAEPPFITYGNLDEAYPDFTDGVFKILLSHNPRHWVDDISGKSEKNIALTLSGHTHAMQIQIAGHSPAKLKYPTDWGLFTDSLGRHLYVNRGLGTVGLPMRIGATPEITLITLSVR